MIVLVKLWGNDVGHLAFNDNGACIFQYSPEFVSMGVEASPIMMPLSLKPYMFDLPSSFSGLPGLISDSLPDKFGNQVIDAWLSAQGRTSESFNVLEKLCYIGKRAMGALEFFPSTKDFASESENIEISDILRLCNEIFLDRKNALVNDSDDLIRQLINVGTSAGGARAKAIVAYNEHNRTFKSGQIDAGKGYEYFIIKFGSKRFHSDGTNTDEYFTRIEYAYYLMALEVGINISESKLINNQGFHFMTKRFDRYVDEKGEMRKIHMSTLGGMAHWDYQDPGAYSYEQASYIMRNLKLKHSEIIEFYKRMVFNVVFRNQDDHVKNISFLMDKQGVWTLSPAYDVTFAYNESGTWTNEHQMRINGKTKNITKNDLLAAGKNMDLDVKTCEHIINSINNIKKKWPSFADKAFLPKDITEEILNLFVELN